MYKRSSISNPCIRRCNKSHRTNIWNTQTYAQLTPVYFCLTITLQNNQRRSPSPDLKGVSCALTDTRVAAKDSPFTSANAFCHIAIQELGLCSNFFLMKFQGWWDHSFSVEESVEMSYLPGKSSTILSNLRPRCLPNITQLDSSSFRRRISRMAMAYCGSSVKRWKSAPV